MSATDRSNHLLVRMDDKLLCSHVHIYVLHQSYRCRHFAVTAFLPNAGHCIWYTPKRTETPLTQISINPNTPHLTHSIMLSYISHYHYHRASRMLITRVGPQNVWSPHDGCCWLDGSVDAFRACLLPCWRACGSLLHLCHFGSVSSHTVTHNHKYTLADTEHTNLWYTHAVENMCLSHCCIDCSNCLLCLFTVNTSDITD